MNVKAPPGKCSAAALEAFRARSEAIIAETTKRSLQRLDEIVQHGEQAERLIRAGLGFTTRMLDATMFVGEMSLMTDQLAWSKDRLPHEQVSLSQVVSRLQIYRAVVLEMLEPGFAAEVVGYLDWMIATLNAMLER